MSEKMNERDWVMLSAYLDDQLDAHSKLQLEDRLIREEQLQNVFQSLRQIRVALHSLPQYKVPRNFTLVKDVQKQKTTSLPAFTSVLRVASVMATVALLVTGYLQLFLRQAPAVSVMTEMATAADAQLTQVDQAPAPLIFWGPGPGVLYDSQFFLPEGKGGFGIGGGGAEMPPLIIASPEEEVPPAELAPEMLTEEQPQMLMQEPSRIKETEKIPLQGSQPILGVPPSAERGQIHPLQTSLEIQEPISQLADLEGADLFPMMIIFASIAIITAFLSLWLPKRQ